MLGELAGVVAALAGQEEDQEVAFGGTDAEVDAPGGRGDPGDAVAADDRQGACGQRGAQVGLDLVGEGRGLARAEARAQVGDAEAGLGQAGERAGQRLVRAAVGAQFGGAQLDAEVGADLGDALLLALGWVVEQVGTQPAQGLAEVAEQRGVAVAEDEEGEQVAVGEGEGGGDAEVGAVLAGAEDRGGEGGAEVGGLAGLGGRLAVRWDRLNVRGDSLL